MFSRFTLFYNFARVLKELSTHYYCKYTGVEKHFQSLHLGEISVQHRYYKDIEPQTTQFNASQVKCPSHHVFLKLEDHQLDGPQYS